MMMKNTAHEASFWSKLRRNRLAMNLLAIAALLLALALAAHLLMQFGTRHGARRTVPDLAGIRLADAERLAAKNDLKLHINDSLFVPAYEGGTVLDQLPKEGVEVKPGRTVYITINSFRQKRVPIPYVAERSLRQAKNMLEIAGLEIAELVYRPDMATNYVLAEFFEGDSIRPGNKLEAEIGSGITLHVGAEPTKNTTAVPQLIGLRLHEAKGRLWESGLNVGRITFDEGIDLLNRKEACVSRQEIGAEHAALLGTAVALHLTLDREAVQREREAAEKLARTAAEERLRAEEERADSLARAALEQRSSEPAAAADAANGPADEFFE